ncbi:hypothetical protein COX67_00850 [Candidatus Falkowbacteria bacterium CG_4_10_14_0_2_um_filter_36_22]|uniref:Response regulatory domain-containing protein n=2 Tax=Candidatus Falkowiibacteriota TaxID=1752728 RepID=A0A1J4T881_9BACT|nr:MAG: hypothetical protein AUJ27_03765 [Candidatus Falkowbacteria bacterium CG1_02_37_44]PIV51141.1 MAG: hypothetical protein COS18_03250 [Candidatus Falkowbacteria bacterium CG02_land_8_20_14_3_00_36_14]PIX11667.1 MAG: hypothetical protein COZ73_02040 [Candidatus Falkowbacteria bacterium CG_4_8_14_3_um_filter_36_11]PJA11235.1 MAG: hypothetical protein COX67_00850 [Candidatus Falkowbacteria bacterium CG_4_10_14_0_2_um_filter_36_22]
MFKKILLIENEEEIINIYKLGLKRAGFIVEVIKNGIWGLRPEKIKQFDIIIMDMTIPAVDGHSSIKILKINKTTKHIPLIVFFNSAQEDDIKRAISLGADAYLIKIHTTPAKLVKKINKMLNSRKE